MTLLSIFGGGLWIIPVLMLIGAGVFTYLGKKDRVYYVPAVLLAFAFIGTLIVMIADK